MGGQKCGLHTYYLNLHWSNGYGMLTAAALRSHIVLDWIPHWDYFKCPIWTVMDLVVAAGLVALFCKPDRSAWWGAFWAVIPDLDVVLSFYDVISENLFPSHHPGFPHGEAAVIPGSLLQVLFIVVFVLVARWPEYRGTVYSEKASLVKMIRGGRSDR